eukprot:7711270-Pyramimonas_sp.AAC.1
MVDACLGRRDREAEGTSRIRPSGLVLMTRRISWQTLKAQESGAEQRSASETVAVRSCQSPPKSSKAT